MLQLCRDFVVARRGTLGATSRTGKERGRCAVRRTGWRGDRHTAWLQPAANGLRKESGQEVEAVRQVDGVRHIPRVELFDDVPAVSLDRFDGSIQARRSLVG